MLHLCRDAHECGMIYHDEETSMGCQDCAVKDALVEALRAIIGCKRCHGTGRIVFKKLHRAQYVGKDDWFEDDPHECPDCRDARGRAGLDRR